MECAMKYLEVRLRWAIQFTVVLLTTAVAVRPALLRAQTDPVSIIDSLMTATYKPDAPGAAILVTKDGNMIFRKAYGMADLELGVKMEPDMVFRIGSMTKQFTAVSILMLQEQGKLALTDEITKFLPDYPTHGKKITIENLLTHTSGIKSYTNMPEWLQLWRKDMTVKELIDFFKNQPMDFDPGENWAYDNSGYILLGAIIEKASGETYQQFVGKHIFDPLGMSHTTYGDASRVILRRVPGYDKGNDGYVNTPYLSMTQPYAAGSLLSNVDDLAHWDAALYTEKLVKQSSLEKAWTPFKLNDGESTGYGYGWAIGEYEGHKIIVHGGGINGFLSSGIRMPDQKLYVIILSNNTSTSPDMISMKIAAMMIGKPMVTPVAITLPPDALDQYVGVYKVSEKEERIITREGDTLFSQRTGGGKNKILPLSTDEFFFQDSPARLVFVRDKGGKIDGVQVPSVLNYGPIKEEKRTDKPLPRERQTVTVDPAIYDRYAGQYELAPGFILTVTREGDHIMAQATGQEKFEIFPESQTRFFYKVVDAELEFKIDSTGTATGLTLYQGGQTVPGQKK